MFKTVILCTGISFFYCIANPTQHTDFTEFDIVIIKTAIKKLPERNQPKNVAQALSFIRQGAQAWNVITNHKIGSAILQNLTNISSQEFGIADKISDAYNTTDEQFWALMKDNTTLKDKANRHDIPFTYESFQKVDYNMYFRSTYVRINAQDKKVQNYFNKFIRAYQTTIVQLQWYFYARAIVQDGKAFTSGMISLQDPDHLLFKTLDGYAELVSPKYKLHSKLSLHSLTTIKAYTRESSHYTGQKYFENDFGIDIQDEKNQPLRILPGNKSQLLFGIRLNGMTFIKWEDYGVTFNPVKGDVSIIPHIKGYFDKKDLEDNPGLHRREKTPQDVLKQFQNVYKKPISKADQNNIKTDGISYMLQLLKDSSQATKFTSYLEKTKGYSADTLQYRKGGEVILMSV